MADRSTKRDQGVGGIEPTDAPKSSNWQGSQQNAGTAGEGGGGGGDGIKGLTDDSNEGKGVGQRMKESIQGLTGGGQGGVSDLTSDDNSSVSPAFGLFFLESELKLNECSKRKKLENLEEARSTKGTSSFS
eukprot:jgi/Astpho2/9897/fgenesh1_pg.00152_%23_17_t